MAELLSHAKIGSGGKYQSKKCNKKYKVTI